MAVNWAMLSGEQTAAAKGPGGLVRIVSGAGTGKTTALIHRIDHLLNRGFTPRDITAISFTRAAAKEIAERVGTTGVAAGVNSMTMHKLALNILREFAGDQPASIVEESEVAGILREVTLEWACKSLSLYRTAPTAAARPIGLLHLAYKIAIAFGADREISRIEAEGDTAAPLAHQLGLATEDIVIARNLGGAKMMVGMGVRERITQWKERLITVEMAADRYVKPTLPPTPKFVIDATKISSELTATAEIYKMFSDRLRRADSMEIADIIMNAVMCMRFSEDIREAVSVRCRMVIVDEAQDINLAQIEFLKLLVSHHKNLTIIGDDDQSIYAFRGVMPGIMDRTKQLFGEAAAKGYSSHSLTIARRTPEAVLQPANLLVGHNPRQEPKILTSGKAGSPPELLRFDSDIQEASALVARVKEIHGRGVALDRIAILCRMRAPLRPVMKSLISGRLRIFDASGGGPLDSAAARNLKSWLRFLMNPRDEAAFCRIISAPAQGLGEVTAAAIIQEAARLHSDIPTAMSRGLIDGVWKKRAIEPITDLLHKIEDMNYAISDGADADEIIAYVLDRSGYMASLRAVKDGADDICNIESIVDIVGAMKAASGGRMTLRDFLDDLALTENIENDRRDSVYVGTIHSSKGLEFDHVIIIGMENGVSPATQVRHRPTQTIWDVETGSIEEERRILHVGMTRAKETCALSYAQRRTLGIIHQIDKVGSMPMSQFIDEMTPQQQPAVRPQSKLKIPMPNLASRFPAKRDTAVGGREIQKD